MVKGFSGVFLGTKTLPTKRVDLQIAKKKKSLYYEQLVNQIKKEKLLMLRGNPALVYS